jgi:hypothetical protein
MFTYAVIMLARQNRYRPELLSSHLDEFGAWTSYRSAPVPAVLVRLEELSLLN